MDVVRQKSSRHVDRHKDGRKTRKFLIGRKVLMTATFSEEFLAESVAVLQYFVLCTSYSMLRTTYINTASPVGATLGRVLIVPVW